MGGSTTQLHSLRQPLFITEEARSAQCQVTESWPTVLKLLSPTETLPRAAVEVAMSRTKESPSDAGAAKEIGLVPRPACESGRGELIDKS